MVQLGSRVEPPIGMPLAVFVSNLQSEGVVGSPTWLVPFERSGGFAGSNHLLGVRCHLSCEPQLTWVQSQSLGNDRAEGLRAGVGAAIGVGSLIEGMLVRSMVATFPRNFPPEDRGGTVVEQIDHEGEVDGIVGLPLGHFEA